MKTISVREIAYSDRYITLELKKLGVERDRTDVTRGYKFHWDVIREKLIEAVGVGEAIFESEEPAGGRFDFHDT